MTTVASKIKTYRVLIVDDDDTIREGVVSYLENFHEADYALVISACADVLDAKQALDESVASDTAFDLVISDINLPNGNGFDVLDHLRKVSPKTKSALITAYKVDDYIRLAKERGVFNIIVKMAPFNFDELSNVVNNLLCPEQSFGLENYMSQGTVLNKSVISNSQQIMDVFQELRTFLAENQQGTGSDMLSTALIEAMTNAVYHVAKNPDGTLKYKKGQEIEQLEENECVSVYYGVDSERLGVSIVDQGGRITADEILYWLDRNIRGAGLLDTHGRGVYLMHSLVDRLLINIEPGRCTEIIVLDYFSDSFTNNKPLFINQL